VPWGCCGPADRMLARVVAPVGGDIRTTTVGGRHVPFPRPSWGGGNHQAQGTECRRDGGKKGGAKHGDDA